MTQMAIAAAIAVAVARGVGHEYEYWTFHWSSLQLVSFYENQV